jgi:hypothetical protein
MRRIILGAFLFVAATSLSCALALATDDPESSYAVVVSKTTASNPEWKKVADTLVKKHRGELVVYKRDVTESLPKLKEIFPKYICFVATPMEANREFVAVVHQLTRKLDDDPYTDALWGIVTGYDAANALRIAETSKPLVIHRVSSGTEVELNRCDEGVWYCELKKNRMVRKVLGGNPEQQSSPDDTTKALVESLNDYKADLLITSGHASEYDWNIGYAYPNGKFQCKDGKIYGLDTEGNRYFVDSPNPKVYMPIGNCLMGHIDSSNCMATSYMNSAGVCQMLGYTVPSWYGYAGWGCLDYFVEQPGRYTFCEAVFANHEALLHRLEIIHPGLATMAIKPGTEGNVKVKLSEGAKKSGLTDNDVRGLLYDRDVLAFYGDPAWSAKMAPGTLNWEQTLTEKDGVFTFEIEPFWGEKTFEPISTNGSQRGGRPIFQWLPKRLGEIEIVDGRDLNPVITDNFILIANPGRCEPSKTYKVVFKARMIRDW